MEMLNVTVNGIAVSVPKGSTILEAARAAGVDVRRRYKYGSNLYSYKPVIPSVRKDRLCR